MKTRNYIISVVPILLIIVIAMWFVNRMFNVPGFQPSSNQAHPETAGMGANAPRQTEASERESNRDAQYNEMQRHWNVPIRFFGKITDQSGLPMPNVEVEFRIRSFPKAITSHARMDFTGGRTTTDNDGKFSINGYNGDVLSIDALRKPGYRMPKQVLSFPYGGGKADHSPDDSRPVLFILVQTGQVKAKVAYENNIRIDWNGDPQKITIGDNLGSIKLFCARDMVGPQQKRGFNWTVRIESTDIAMVEKATYPPSPSLAPSIGYNDFIRLGGDEHQTPWNDFQERRIYIKTKDGRYGLINLGLYIARPNDSNVGAVVSVLLAEPGTQYIEK